jgi:hypothetical protein
MKGMLVKNFWLLTGEVFKKIAKLLTFEILNLYSNRNMFMWD